MKQNFQFMGIRQQRTVVSDRWKTDKASPMTAPSLLPGELLQTTVNSGGA